MSQPAPLERTALLLLLAAAAATQAASTHELFLNSTPVPPNYHSALCHKCDHISATFLRMHHLK
jgi:hypothetical protein